MDGRERQPQQTPMPSGQNSHEPRAWNGVVSYAAPGASVGPGSLADRRPSGELIGARGIGVIRAGGSLLQDVDIAVKPADPLTPTGPPCPHNPPSLLDLL